MSYVHDFERGLTHAPGLLWHTVGGFLWIHIGIVLTALFLLVFVLMLTRMPRPVSARRIKPDKKSPVRWDEVAGLDEAKAELAEVVEFLRDPTRFAKVGARVPKGVLLHGPPGTGKTLLAKAVAGESGSAFFSVSAASFVEVYSGTGAARIRALFKAARKHAPSIIFIDELDAIGQVRATSGMNREQDQTLNQLLVELDGFGTKRNVIMIASTNRLDSLDPALLRPGRFDRQAFVPPPDIAARDAILAVHTRAKPLAADVRLNVIARVSAGLSGADLENICNEAAIRAGRAERKEITASDFDEAFERVLTGVFTHRTMSESEKRAIAYHEAGHAVISHLVDRSKTIHKVTIVPRGGALGYNLILPSKDRVLVQREELIGELQMLLGGRAAEQVVLGSISTGASGDLVHATQIARSMVSDWGMGGSVTTRTLDGSGSALSEELMRLRDSQTTQLCDDAYDDALRLLAEHRPALDRLAAALLERETLDRDEILALLHDVGTTRATTAA